MFFSFKVFNTYRFWKLIGGIAKYHPNEKDIYKFKIFLKIESCGGKYL